MIKQLRLFDKIPVHLFVIVAVTFFCYECSLDNFFYGDDFIWLYRIKQLPGNWSSIFTIENRYFTPLTYLSFFINNQLAGLNPFWFHLHDVIIHALNGVLLYLLTFQISGNRIRSLLAALLFVSSSTILITVLWPSARTDLLMMLFSLAALSVFVRANTAELAAAPVALYLLALCAKGTALLLPFVMLLLMPTDQPFKRRFVAILPYGVINMAYVALLFIVNSLSKDKSITGHNVVSLANLARSLPALIIPERYLAAVSVTQLTMLSIILLIAIIAITIRFNDISARAGAALSVAGLLPLLFARDYVLTGNKAITINMLSSPSNRLYMASAGTSILIAILLQKIICSEKRKHIGLIILLLLIYGNYREIRLRNEVWRTGTNHVRREVTYLSRYAGLIEESNVLFLFNFEGSHGFSKALLGTYFNAGSLEVHRLDVKSLDEFTDIDKSLLNTENKNDISKVRLFLGCPGNRNTDSLTYTGNMLLQGILTNYREFYRCNTRTEAEAIKSRQQEMMVKLESTLKACLQAK